MTPPSTQWLLFALAVLCAAPGGIAPLYAAPEAPKSSEIKETPEQRLEQPAYTDRAIEARGFADYLFHQGEYYRAIGEYQRYLYLRPNAPDAEQIRLRGAMAYLFGGEYSLANEALAQVGLSIKDPTRLRLAAFGRCQANYLNGTWLPASAHLRTFLRTYPPDDAQSQILTNHALLMSGWTFLRLERLEEAERSFAELAKHSKPELGYTKLVTEVHALRTSPPSKKPWVAGLLSVVPGLGHAYLERADIALFALAWNSLFIYAANDSIIRGDYGAGSILSAFAFLWYSGTIYGAVSGAHKWNRDMRSNKLDELEETYPPDPGLDYVRANLKPEPSQ